MKWIFIILVFTQSAFSAEIVCKWIRNNKRKPLTIFFDNGGKVASNFGKCKFKTSNQIRCRAPGFPDIRVYLSKGSIDKKNRLSFHAREKVSTQIRRHTCLLAKIP